MTVLDNFTEEILQSELPKNVLLHNMIRGLDKEKPPQFEVPAKKYTFESNLHGFSYDYQHSTVTISYKVADGAYSDITVSFRTFRAYLEGLAVCVRMQKW